MKTHRPILTACTLTWLTAAAAAQPQLPDSDPRAETSELAQPVRPTQLNGLTQPIALPHDLLIPIHTAENDEVGGAYGLWAMGRNYKVAFGEGMTFVPLLGPDADGQSVRWATDSVRIGDRELLTAFRPAGRRASELRYEYDHGRVVEAYDVRAEGLEQTFVIASRPEQLGDLVVEGRLHGSLHAAPRHATHRDLALLDADGRSVVEYGAATAVDASGRTFPMTTAVQDDRVSLRLAAASVAAARFPLTVDPLLSNAILDSVEGISGVRAFRDHQQPSENLWIAYAFDASATDRDVVVRRFDDDYRSPGITVFADVTDRWDSTEPALTGVGNFYDGSTITVFTREFSGNQRRVRWHRHRKFDRDLSTAVSSAPWQGAEQWRPTVGGAATQAFGWTALIAFQEEPGTGFVNGPRSRIRALEIRLDSGQHTRVDDLVVDGDTDNERPSIHQISDGGSDYSWVVAWQSFDNAAGGPWKIAVGNRQIRIPRDYVTTLLPHRTGHHAVAPVIGGMFGKCVVAYGERPALHDKPLEATARTLRTQRVDWQDNVATPTFPAPAQRLQSRSSDVLEAGSCAFDYADKSHWALTWRDLTPGDPRLFVAKLGFEGAPSERHTVYRVAGQRPTRGSLCFDYDHREFLLTFGVAHGTQPDPLFGTRLTFEDAPVTEEYGTACSVAATWTYEGSQRIGSDAEWFRLQAPLANTGVLLALGFGPAALPLDAAGMPGCRLAVDTGALALGTVQATTDANGHAAVHLAVPSSLQPFDLYAQWFLVAPGANAAGVASSRGLKVPYVR